MRVSLKAKYLLRIGLLLVEQENQKLVETVIS